jgi:hypothetical protein
MLHQNWSWNQRRDKKAAIIVDTTVPEAMDDLELFVKEQQVLNQRSPRTNPGCRSAFAGPYPEPFAPSCRKPRGRSRARSPCCAPGPCRSRRSRRPRRRGPTGLSSPLLMRALPPWYRPPLHFQAALPSRS